MQRPAAGWCSGPNPPPIDHAPIGHHLSSPRESWGGGGGGDGRRRASGRRVQPPAAGRRKQKGSSGMILFAPWLLLPAAAVEHAAAGEGKGLAGSHVDGEYEALTKWKYLRGTTASMWQHRRVINQLAVVGFVLPLGDDQKLQDGGGSGARTGFGGASITIAARRPCLLRRRRSGRRMCAKLSSFWSAS